MTGLVVASLVPALLDIHADAQNAAVLAARARWQGHEARVADVVRGEDAADLTPDLITIGSGFDADAGEVLDALRAFEANLRRWVDAGVPLLAVGLGWELLSTSVELEPGSPTPGLGLFTGRAVASGRHVGTVAVDSRWGRLVGYEYHLRDYILGEDEAPLGTIVSGVGNREGAGGGSPEGALRGSLVGTGIRGPVLARNPALADDLLGRARARRTPADVSLTVVDAQSRADHYAHEANHIVLRNMGIGRDA